KAAFKLDENERELLAEKLFQSLKRNTFDDVDEAWIEEIERRYQAYQKGSTKPIPASRVFDDIRKDMGWEK
ncbi:MAG: addiction module protein, partial [Calditrichaeota bacterium]|nr:addiction module protein [Calditrichota bacterium]